MPGSKLFGFAVEGLLTEEQTTELVRPLASPLVACWYRAWKGWKAIPEDLRIRINQSPTARANVVNALATSYAKELLPEIDSIEICEDLQFFKFYIGDTAVLRLKRLDDDRLARNFSTEQQKLWYAHRHIEGIKDGATRLTVGYVLDAAQQEIKEVLVTLQLKNDLVYAIRLDDPAVLVRLPEQPAPVQPAQVLPIGGRKKKAK